MEVGLGEAVGTVAANGGTSLGGAQLQEGWEGGEDVHGNGNNHLGAQHSGDVEGAGHTDKNLNESLGVGEGASSHGLG